MTVPVAGRGPEVLGVAGMFLALSTISVGLRCYTRAVIVKSFGLDDWSAFVAWVCHCCISTNLTETKLTYLQVFFVFFCTFAISGVHHGTGQHAGTFPLVEIPVGLKVDASLHTILCFLSNKFSGGGHVNPSTS